MFEKNKLMVNLNVKIKLGWIECYVKVFEKELIFKISCCKLVRIML